VNAKDRPVIGPDGNYGTVDTTCWPSLDEKTEPEVDVQLHDGTRITIPADSLIEQKDGSYYLPLTQKKLDGIPHHPDRAPKPDGSGWPCREEPR